VKKCIFAVATAALVLAALLAAASASAQVDKVTADAEGIT
jgi:hypothetical protein